MTVELLRNDNEGGWVFRESLPIGESVCSPTLSPGFCFLCYKCFANRHNLKKCQKTGGNKLANCGRSFKAKLVHFINLIYHKARKRRDCSREEEQNVAKIYNQIKNMKLTTEEQRYYGLDQKSREQIPEKVLLRIAAAIEKNKEALKELKKY